MSTRRTYAEFVFILLFVFSPLALFLFRFGSGTFSEKISDWSAFATYLTGTAGLLITFAALWYAYLAYKTQAKNSFIDSFENRLFRLLEFQYKIIESLSLNSGSNSVVGRQALINFYNTLCNHFESELLARISNSENDNGSLSEYIRTEYTQNFDESVHGLRSYFNQLSHIMLFLENTPRLSIQEKIFYSEIIRTQLSGSEIIILAIHGLSDYHPALKQQIETHGLLRELTYHTGFRAVFVRLYDRSAFGNERTDQTLPFNEQLSRKYYNQQ